MCANDRTSARQFWSPGLHPPAPPKRTIRTSTAHDRTINRFFCLIDRELLEKLAALVPAPRFHLVRYFGILAAAAKQRPSIVPVPTPVSSVESCAHRDTAIEEKRHARNYSWSQLMARIFAVDVLACPRCDSRMRILAAIEDPSVARKVLDCLGLPSRPPPVAPARRNRHLEIAEL